MRNLLLCVVCLLGSAWLAGCKPSRMEMAKPGTTSEIVSASVENLGWGRAFGGAPANVSFTAVVTTYDNAGRKYTDRQEMAADLASGNIAAKGATPGGSWTAVANVGLMTRLDADPGVNQDVVRKRMSMVLPTLLHRIRGPYNLVGGTERPRSPRKTQVGGVEVVRIGVTGDNRNAVAYYFEPATGILRHVTSQADRPAGDGTVTSYEYRSLSNGAAFPKVIRVNRVGRNVLLGDVPVFQVEISNVRF